MPLTAQQLRHLRGLGHHLKPVIMIGQHGLHEAVFAEIEQALDAHELVKIKIAAERDARKQIAQEITTRTGAEAVHQIGQMLIVFRRNAEAPKIALPST
jgi:RNA-binding protein